MKITQIVFLGVAVAAGAAAFLMTNQPKAPPTKAVIVREAPKFDTGDVLVAAREIQMGTVLSRQDLGWQAWPKSDISSAMIAEASDPQAMSDVEGAIARSPFIRGEPIQDGKLVKGAKSGFLSAILPEGERAVAINIDSQGSTTAGGFILPDDRVDVLRTERDEEAAKAGNADAYKTQIILSNIRVLAIGQNIQEQGNKKVVVGSNATLEVTPEQAEILVEAQRVGQLSLALRSMMDTNKPSRIDQGKNSGMTIVRYGVALSTGQD